MPLVRSLVVLIAVVLAIFPALAEGQSGEIDWQSDLEVLTAELKAKHIDLFAKFPESEFDKQAAQIKERIPTAGNDQILVDFFRLIANLGDSHTAISPDFDNWHFLPMQFYWFEEGIYCIAATGGAETAFGARMVSMGGKPIDEVAASVASCLAIENESQRKNLTVNFLNAVEILKGTNVLSGNGPYEVVFEKDGAPVKINVSPQTRAELKAAKWASRTVEPAMYERKSQLDHWNDWLADEKTLFFKYNRCQNKEAFQKLVNGTAGFIKQNKVERFVLDLRDNSGGDSAIFKPLLEYLSKHPALNRKGRLYVIIGRKTFSSAVLNALEMRGTKAIFVGEPTGGRPNHFGEVKQFSLPNSKLTVNYSTKRFEMIRDSNPDSLEPDIVVPMTFADWQTGRDPVMARILSEKITP